MVMISLLFHWDWYFQNCLKRRKTHAKRKKEKKYVSDIKLSRKANIAHGSLILWDYFLNPLEILGLPKVKRKSQKFTECLPNVGQTALSAQS